MCDSWDFIASHIWRNTGTDFQPKASRACIIVWQPLLFTVAIHEGLYFQLYYLNCPGKYVQRLYYQFMAPLATPLIQQLKHCNRWLKLSARGA